MNPEITMDQNNLPEGIGYGVGGTAVLVWLATQLKALLRRDKVDAAEADADVARAKAASAQMHGAAEFLNMARISNAQLIRTIEDMRKEHAEQITALQQKIEEMRLAHSKEIYAMRQAHSKEIAILQHYVRQLGGSLKDFADSRAGGFN